MWADYSVREIAELLLEGVIAIPSEESAVIDLIVEEFYDPQDPLGISPQNITEWLFGEGTLKYVDLGVEDLKRKYPDMSDEDFKSIISLFKEVIDKRN